MLEKVRHGFSLWGSSNFRLFNDQNLLSVWKLIKFSWGFPGNQVLLEKVKSLIVNPSFPLYWLLKSWKKKLFEQKKLFVLQISSENNELQTSFIDISVINQKFLQVFKKNSGEEMICHIDFFWKLIIFRRPILIFWCDGTYSSVIVLAGFNVVNQY